jgi:cysteine-rich repeat protein
MNKGWVLASSVLLLLASAGSGRAATVYVDTTADLMGEKCSLRAAVASVNAGALVSDCLKVGDGPIDTIRLLPGFYSILTSPMFPKEIFSSDPGDSDDDAGAFGDLDVLKSVKIIGAGREKTILAAVGDSHRLLHVNPKGEPGITVEISDLTLQDGSVRIVDDGGGCLFNEKASLTLTRVAVRNCRVDEGLGGGLVNRRGTMTIEGSLISANRAELSGGGILNDQGTLTLTDSTVSGNQTTEARGGGIFNAKGTVTLVNVTVSDNASRFSGAGLYNFDGKVSATNATVAFNQADFSKYMLGGGGGIVSTEAGEVTLANTILAKNLAWSDEEPDCLGTLTSLGHNLLGDLGGHGACLMTAAEGDQIGSPEKPVDPKLAAWKSPSSGDTLYIPLDGSLAIDLADGTLCPAADERGIARPQADGCDIGAVERLKYEMLKTVTELGAVLPPPPMKIGEMGMLGAEQPPVCGNGVREGKEECDDHNTVSGDGCSSTCRKENPVIKVQPNFFQKMFDDFKW